MQIQNLLNCEFENILYDNFKNELNIINPIKIKFKKIKITKIINNIFNEDDFKIKILKQIIKQIEIELIKIKSISKDEILNIKIDIKNKYINDFKNKLKNINSAFPDNIDDIIWGELNNSLLNIEMEKMIQTEINNLINNKINSEEYLNLKNKLNLINKELNILYNNKSNLKIDNLKKVILKRIDLKILTIKNNFNFDNIINKNYLSYNYNQLFLLCVGLYYNLENIKLNDLNLLNILDFINFVEDEKLIIITILIMKKILLIPNMKEKLIKQREWLKWSKNNKLYILK